MEKAWSTSQMETFIRVTSVKANSMGLDNSFGKVDSIIKATSVRDCEAGMGSGRVEEERVTNTKDNSRTIKNRDTGYTPGRVATSTRETTRKTCEVDMERCIGRTAVFIEDFGSWISKMAKENASTELKNLSKATSSTASSSKQITQTKLRIEWFNMKAHQLITNLPPQFQGFTMGSKI
jgi:hypothetical protein